MRTPVKRSGRLRWVPRLVLLAVLAALIAAPSGSVVRSHPPRHLDGSPAPPAPLVREIGTDQVVGPPGSEPDTAVEPDVAVDPTDPRVLVAVFQEGRFPDAGAAAIGFASSRDGGRTWIEGTLPGLTLASGGPFQRASDPSVAFGPDGIAYASSVVFGRQGPRNAIAVNRSGDGGRTWLAPVFVERSDRRELGLDFPRIAVDDSPASPHAGRVYVAYSRRNRVVLHWSDDRGVTWSGPRTVSVGQGFVPVPVVGPDGALTLVFVIPRGRRATDVAARTSRDGGRRFGPQVVIGPMDITSPPDQRSGGVAEAAADPVTGDLYAVWQDEGARRDGVSQVVIASSLDGGATWSRHEVAPDSGHEHLLPAVAARGGRVVVAFLAREVRRGTRSPIIRLKLASSDDQGATFGAEWAVGPAGNLRYAARARPRGVAFVGDYLGASLAPRSVVVVWPRPSPPRSAGRFHVTVWAAALVPPVTGQR